MPRPRKSAPLRANRETRDFGVIPTTQQRPAHPIPLQPRGLLSGQRQSWADYWSSPLARILVPATDAPALARLWTLYDERARMYRGIRRHRIVVGAKGQPRGDPLYAQMAALDSAIAALERQFGMTPKSRLELGVVLGDAARSLADLNDEL